LQNQFPDAVQQIANELRALAEPLREKDWESLRRYIAGAEVVIKGAPCGMARLERLIFVQTANLREIEIVVEDLLHTEIESARIDLWARVAALGRRIKDGRPDGIIMDTQLMFFRHDNRWRLQQISVDCPPLWAQWNSRPNEQAPIHYGDLAWWELRQAQRTVRETEPRARPAHTVVQT
jgi:hypothetical protein